MTTRQALAAMIDHTLLKPEATAVDIDRLCDEALRHHFAAVCVNPVWVARCAERLASSTVRLASVAGFPLGASRSEVKADEARRAIDDGAVEVDMVISVGNLIDGNVSSVRDDIAAVAEAVHAGSRQNVLKVILETAVLTERQIIAGCRCAAEAGADFVKTSTGFHPAGGATVEAVRVLRAHAGLMKVKAAGGIRTLDVALAMIAAGADRLGCSASVEIVRQLPA
ncbi:MAG TPA: deoxyribose-phosphate aldolase [Phycisphaerae bacterium]|nr:deoxyribose-phosphate aldolase [Phycisphaerae bacterium]HRR84631.1 deoxyribose-phosphate aldolase [Phycisphaerae bacterium]